MNSKILNISEQFTFSELVNFVFKKSFRKRRQKRLKQLVDRGVIFNPNFINHNSRERVEFVEKLDELNFTKNLLLIKEKVLFKNEISKIIKEAEYYTNNQFNIFGSGWSSWENDGKIDWQKDIKSGFVWDVSNYYLEISKSLKQNISKNKNLKIDIKIPRELSRFYFIFTLYSAYILTDDKKYLNKVKNLILCWIENNPPFFGVNWTNAMEAAIRIINWSLVIYALKKDLLQDYLFMEKFYSSLYQHLLYIMANLENVFHRNNHYLSNVIGVYVASSLFPVFKESRKWQRWSAKEIKKEFSYQVYEDGGNFESSTSYHRLALELLFLPQYLAKYLGGQLFDDIENKKLEKMFIMIMNTIKPNGENLQFGDNDNGSVFKLYERKSLDHTYLIPLGYGLFNNKDLARNNIPFDLLSYIFFGVEKQQNYNRDRIKSKALTSVSFKNTGIYILRNDKIFLAVSCMPNGQYGKGVHTHNDKLSFEMNYHGENVIVDPGTYCYTSNPQLRNRFRSTRYHNTVMENRLEQNEFGANIFQLFNQTRITVHHFSENELDCEHCGFIKRGGSRHKRTFILFENRLSIHDFLDKNLPAEAFYHFAPGITISANGEKIAIKKQEKILGYLKIEMASKIRIEDYDYSPSYGEKVVSKKIKIDFKKQLNSTFIFKYR